MLGIIIMGHANLSHELIQAAEHILGPQEQLVGISILPEDDPEAKRQELCTIIAQLNTGSGVVILTDMFGGTPSNLAISCLEEGLVEVIAGVNLPMLVKLIDVRSDHSLAQATKLAAEAGKHYIKVATELLPTRQHVKTAS
jgi:PTS system mannose-specific IIA component